MTGAVKDLHGKGEGGGTGENFTELDNFCNILITLLGMFYSLVNVSFLVAPGATACCGDCFCCELSDVHPSSDKLCYNNN